MSKCNVVFTTFRARVPGEWYFDGGSFRHMTNNRSFFLPLLKTSMEERSLLVMTVLLV